MADSELEALTALALANIADTDVLYIVDVSAGTGHKVDASVLADYVHARGEVAKAVTATQTNTTVTPAAVTDLTTSLIAGTYRIKVWLVWQTAATATGASFFINCSGGTVTRNVGHVYTTTTGGTATTGIADQATVAATFQMVEARAWRANNTDPGPFGGVDTANADQFAVLEAIVIVTATTSMQIMFRSEVAASGVSIMTGTVLEYEKVA